jgi:hypothetical protein
MVNSKLERLTRWSGWKKTASLIFYFVAAIAKNGFSPQGLGTSSALGAAEATTIPTLMMGGNTGPLICVNIANG